VCGEREKARGREGVKKNIDTTRHIDLS
jgi:hypothetical protein